MNVALLHYSAPPVVGGVESVLDHHARLMADDGHQVIRPGRARRAG
jgi:mannosylglucosylglycerate synthase